MYLSCSSSKFWIILGVLENYHVIRIQTKSALTFMEQILCEIDHGKIIMKTTCKQLSNFKTLWCFINRIIKYKEIYFVFPEIFVQLFRSTNHIFHVYFHKLFKQTLLMLCITPNNVFRCSAMILLFNSFFVNSVFPTALSPEKSIEKVCFIDTSILYRSLYVCNIEGSTLTYIASVVSLKHSLLKH